MKIIVPMAGKGTRLRPHTLTVPKPLIPIAGKPIVERLIEDIVKVCNEKITEIAFIIGDFGKETEEKLINIAKKHGVEGKIYYQNEKLGTAHAVYCARESLKGKTIIAFADTLFKASLQLDDSKDGVIWVKQVENPSDFGVVKTDDNNIITEFTEKPQTFVSDLAIIGIYYFREGEDLSKKIDYLINNDIKAKGEYQLTDALEMMRNEGKRLSPGKVDEWLDCGNKDVTVYANKRYLEYLKNDNLISDSSQYNNSVIIPPVFIDEETEITNSVIGPYVSIGKKTQIKNAIISNSIIQKQTLIVNSIIEHSMIGNNVFINGKPKDLSIGDYTTIKE